MKIRPAALEEAATLTQIAHDAKRHWGYPERWIEHWQQDLTITPGFISDNEVYVAESEGALMGFYALAVADEKAELEHMWVAPAYLGQGIGKELFVHAMQTAAGQNHDQVEICSDPNAEGFYKKMGAEPVGQVASFVDGEPRVIPRLNIDPRKL